MNPTPNGPGWKALKQKLFPRAHKTLKRDGAAALVNYWLSMVHLYRELCQCVIECQEAKVPVDLVKANLALVETYLLTYVPRDVLGQEEVNDAET